MHTRLIQTFLLSVVIGASAWFLGCGDKKETGTAVSCEGMACWDPPEQTCAEGRDDCLSIYNAVGWCAEGTCNYARREEDCIAGMCSDGVCEETPCLGTTCAEAPAYRCADENTLVVNNPIGYCASNSGMPECRYADKGVPCENGCKDGACEGDPCLHKICFKPPARYCDGNDVIVWNSIGGCEDGECVYGFQAVTCSSGCENGHCVGTDPCSVMTCNVQPASFCADNDTLRAYESSGSCAEGACYYAHREITCTNGCEGGQCQEQECAGVICDIPIASYCRGGGSLSHWDGSEGACEDGFCSYQTTSTDCAPVCSDAKCEDDPCIGVFCTKPPADYCTDDTTLVEYEGTGTCGDGHCGYESDDTVCASVCDKGDCVAGGDAGTDCHLTAEVQQPGTNLYWLRCPLGQDWDVETCSCAGTATSMDWCDASGVDAPEDDLCQTDHDGTDKCLLTYPGTGWRLPAAEELSVLLEETGLGNEDGKTCDGSIDSMCTGMFGPDESSYWSSSAVEYLAWVAYFDRGGVSQFNKLTGNHVRCIRTGP